jgi:hypothetical protein
MKVKTKDKGSLVLAGTTGVSCQYVCKVNQSTSRRQKGRGRCVNLTE